MTYTILKDSEDELDAEGFIALATSEFGFIVLRIKGEQEVLANVE
jgi:hypothetical protein